MTTNAIFSLLLIGSNINASQHLQKGLGFLGEKFDIDSKSPIYQSPPVGAPGTADYLNQALIICDPPPHDHLRSQLRLIEDVLGRKRSSDPNAPRTIDIDILAYAGVDLQILGEFPCDAALETLHHAAIPAAMIAPDWRFPGQGKTISEASRSLGPAPAGFLVVT
ncbi:MAG: 2-amino-4-hydroxy-6-hydroxymethyldihydropteridine diphosphokinase [Planctomycetota bacterium]|nr:2-amino-4-hydroxy-6-hydroxymethyldihydropteridine diphosphokinase [Planctomycetota bacterium]